MKKIALLTLMVGFLIFAHTGIASADQELDCRVESSNDILREAQITCDWDEPSDCASAEPAYDECENYCSQFWPPLVNYNETGGNPCGNFHCQCQFDIE